MDITANMTINANDTYEIYLNNYEYINKSFKQKNKAYGTLFEKEMVNLWICDGELVTKNCKKIKPSDHFNECSRWKFINMEFEFKDGYLISNLLLKRECNIYKFKCINY